MKGNEYKVAGEVNCLAGNGGIVISTKLNKEYKVAGDMF